MKTDMEKEAGIPSCLYEDEVVRYLAARYHTSAEAVIRCYLVQEGCIEASGAEVDSWRLESNEMAILHDLICLVKGR